MIIGVYLCSVTFNRKDIDLFAVDIGFLVLDNDDQSLSFRLFKEL